MSALPGGAQPAMFSRNSTVCQSVLEAFGANGAPTLFESGQGNTYRCGSLVLKPVGNTDEANWVADLFSNLLSDGFRIPVPVRSKDNTWVYDGWVCWTLIEGKPEGGKWLEKLDVSRRFHKAIDSIEKPAFFDRRTDPWAVADRAAWGELEKTYDNAFGKEITRLTKLLRPISQLNQVIHGDIAGNILFCEGQLPGVIDFSPYWRPAGFSAAVIIVDALVWDGADDSIFELANGLDEFDQLVVRAEIRRLAELAELHEQRNRDCLEEVEVHKPAIDIIVSRSHRG